MSDPQADIEDVLLASRGMLGIIARSMAPALEQVTVPQFRLIVLATALGPTRSGELADRLAVQTSTLTRNVDRLVAGGWVERRPSLSSRREVLIAATDRGEELVREVTARRRAELEGLLAGLGADEARLLMDAAAVFHRAVREPDPAQVSRFGG